MFFKSCEPEIVFVLICTLAEQFQVHNSYKTRESTFEINLEENIDLSHIHLAVQTFCWFFGRFEETKRTFRN